MRKSQQAMFGVKMVGRTNMQNVWLLLHQHAGQAVIGRPGAKAGGAGQRAAACANNDTPKLRHEPGMNLSYAAGTNDGCSHHGLFPNGYCPDRIK